MEKYVRSEKPLTRTALEAPGGKSKGLPSIPRVPTASAPSETGPKQKECARTKVAPWTWEEVLSEQADTLDVRTLSKAEVEDILRLFDVNATYGPFVGVDRLARWERASRWGLHPPQIVHRVLLLGCAHARRDRGSVF